MKTYLLTSTKWSGEIELRYNDEGYLLGYDNRANMEDAQRNWFLQYMPRSINDLRSMVAATKTSKLQELPEAEIAFEMFWERYNDKIHSSKKRAETKWRQMTKGNQQRAYLYIPRYFASIPNGLRKKHVETYLGDELWNN